MQWEARHTLKGIMGFPHTHCSKHVPTLKHSNIYTHVYMHMCSWARACAREHTHVYSPIQRKEINHESKDHNKRKIHKILEPGM